MIEFSTLVWQGLAVMAVFFLALILGALHTISRQLGALIGRDHRTNGER